MTIRVNSEPTMPFFTTDGCPNGFIAFTTDTPSVDYVQADVIGRVTWNEQDGFVTIYGPQFSKSFRATRAEFDELMAMIGRMLSRNYDLIGEFVKMSAPKPIDVAAVVPVPAAPPVPVVATKPARPFSARACVYYMQQWNLIEGSETPVGFSDEQINRMWKAKSEDEAREILRNTFGTGLDSLIREGRFQYKRYVNARSIFLRARELNYALRGKDVPEEVIKYLNMAGAFIIPIDCLIRFLKTHDMEGIVNEIEEDNKKYYLDFGVVQP